jgi:nitroreductase
MDHHFKILETIITNRRTTKPNLMNGLAIPDEQVHQILNLANWAPTHAHTEPWRFIVYKPTSKQHFCEAHALLYKQYTPQDKFMQATYDKLLHMSDKASHIAIAYMQRGSNPKITALEEVAATSAAIQNMLLGASALNIAAYWGSGGMVMKPEMKAYFNLHEADTILGAIYLGYTNEPSKLGKRLTPIDPKVEWR